MWLSGQSWLAPHAPHKCGDFVDLLLFPRLPLLLLHLQILPQLANFRQRKTKGDGPNSKKKTAKRKGSAVHASVQEEGSVAPPNSELPQGAAVSERESCGNTLEETGGAFAAQVGLLVIINDSFLAACVRSLPPRMTLD